MSQMGRPIITKKQLLKKHALINPIWSWYYNQLKLVL